MFRVSQHPSSGVLKTVTAASGTGHNIGTATSLQRGLIGMCVCMYVCMCVYVCMYVCMYVCVRMYVCMCVYVCMYVCMCTLKLEEAVTRYTFRDTQQQQTRNLDQDVEYRNWPHPAKAIAIVETQSHEEATIRVYTDGSKYQGGVGSGVVIYRERNIIARR